MALWTLFGLTSGKATTPWPAARWSGWTGRRARHAALQSRRLQGGLRGVRVGVSDATRSRPEHGGLAVDYGRCVVCQLCTEACPTGAMKPSNDWAFGVRDRADLVWSNDEGATGGRNNDRGPKRVSPQPAYPPRRCWLVQRMRVRTSSASTTLLQSASIGDFLHALAPICRSASGDWTCHPSHVRAAQGGLRGDAGAALGDGRRNLRGLGRNSRAATMPAGPGLKGCFPSISTSPAARQIRPRSWKRF